MEVSYIIYSTGCLQTSHFNFVSFGDFKLLYHCTFGLMIYQTCKTFRLDFIFFLSKLLLLLLW